MVFHPFEDSHETPRYRRPTNEAFRGRGRDHFGGSSRLQCQLCSKFGHLVDRCYFRFNTTYKAPSSRPSHMMPTTSFGQPKVHNSVYGGSTIQGPSINGHYYLGHNYPNPTPPHIGPTSQSPLTFNTIIESHSSPPSIPSAPTHPNLLGHYPGATSSSIGNSIDAPTEPSVSLATPTVVSDNAWYPNSRATNHLTSDASQLESRTIIFVL